LFAGPAHKLLPPGEEFPGSIHAKIQGLRQGKGIARFDAMAFVFGDLFFPELSCGFSLPAWHTTATPASSVNSSLPFLEG